MSLRDSEFNEEIKRKMNHNEESSILIEWNEWHHKCADGCCDTYGVEVWLDGKSIGSREFGDATSILEMVLEHLGHSAEVRQLISDQEQQ